MRNATLISRFVAAIGISGERTGDDPKVIDVPGNLAAPNERTDSEHDLEFSEVPDEKYDPEKNI